MIANFIFKVASPVEFAAEVHEDVELGSTGMGSRVPNQVDGSSPRPSISAEHARRGSVVSKIQLHKHLQKMVNVVFLHHQT